MLRFVTTHKISGHPLTRREWLRVGGMMGLAGWLPGMMQQGMSPHAQASPQSPPIAGFGRAKSVILVFASGGQSQLETWDPKPNAPREVRGEFDSIETSVSGLRLTEHLPRLAKLAHLYTVARSLSHDDVDHGSAAYQMLTGKPHRRKSSNPPPSPTDEPTFGAVLKRVRPTSASFADAVHVNGPALVPELIAPGQDGGFLGRECEPMLIGDVSRGPLAVPGLMPQAGLPSLRIRGRWQLKQELDGFRGALAEHGRTQDLDQLYERALGLLESPACREAFLLEDEPETVRARYGWHRSGQACLLARRLVEAEVPLITVIWNHTNRGQDNAPDDPEAYGWDTHNDVFAAMKNHLLPRFDQSFSALLEDLEQRGLLSQTLVICCGEFGRAPLVALEPRFAGSSPGRKHWAGTYSAVFAGAGIQRGGVFGTSDRFAGYPSSHAVGPWDVAATLYSALGIDPAGHFNDDFDRPFPLTIGSPIQGLYG